MTTVIKRLNRTDLPFQATRDLFSSRSKVGRQGLLYQETSCADVRVRLPPAEDIAISAMSAAFGSAKAVEGKILIIEGMKQVMREFPELAAQAREEIKARGLPVPDWLRELGE